MPALSLAARPPGRLRALQCSSRQRTGKPVSAAYASQTALTVAVRLVEWEAATRRTGEPEDQDQACPWDTPGQPGAANDHRQQHPVNRA
jgi:hypothetical protein